MQFSIVGKGPENQNLFDKIPGTDCREAFIKSLRYYVQAKKERICTDSVPIEWVTMVGKVEDLSPYSVSMQRVAVNFGEPGEAYGKFFFVLKTD